MSISDVVLRSWRYFLSVFDVNNDQTLLKTLCEVYRIEANAVVQYTQQAGLMCYPQFRVEMLRIAAEVQAHLPWLHERILALEGSLPATSPPSTGEHNGWECLRRDLEEARRDGIRLLEWIHRVEREEPEIAAGLQRIRKDKLRHREEFRQLFMKSDPYTNSTPRSLQEPKALQKQTWLEERKNDWMDHERTEWEIEGKQTTWAEWSGEQEFKWVTELPHYDREWAQYLAEQRDAERRHPIS